MRRAAHAVLAVLFALALVASASPVAAHGNHVEVDSQRSADGTVLVEAVRPLTDGFVVLHRATDDGVGEPLGHTAVGLDDGFQRTVPVEMDADAWADWPDSDDLWVVFHADDGDGEFEPRQDEATDGAFGGVNGRQITLAKADRPASVLAEREQPQQTATASATVARATLPEDGFLVLRTEPGAAGRVAGTVALDAGTHEDVAVPVDASAFPENSSTVGLYGQLAVDDGDGAFTDADRLVRADDAPVSSYFFVWRVDEEPATTPGDANVWTPPDDADTAAASGPETTDSETDESDAGVPGYGVVHAAAAVAVTAILLVRR